MVMRTFMVVRYVGPDDFGTVVRENLPIARALHIAAQLNARAELNTLYCIESVVA
jgi:hypothetical protein